MSLRRQLALLLAGFVLITLALSATLATVVVTGRFRAAADRALRADARAFEAGIADDLAGVRERLWSPTFEQELRTELARVATGQGEAWEVAPRTGGRHGLDVLLILTPDGTVISNRHWPSDYGTPGGRLAGPWPEQPPSAHQPPAVDAPPSAHQPPAADAPPGANPPPGDGTALPGSDGAAVRWALVPRGLDWQPVLATGRRLAVGSLAFDVVAGVLLDPGALDTRASAIGAAVGVELDGRWYWGAPGDVRAAMASGFPPAAMAATLATMSAGGAVRHVEADGEGWRLWRCVWDVAPGANGAVARSEAPLATALADLYRILLGAAAASTLAALVAGALLARRLARPLELTASAAERVARGDLETQVAELGPLENRVLAATFNRMTDELRADRERLVQAERLGAWRDVARRLAHEIGNALSPIQLSLDALRRARAGSPEGLARLVDDGVRIMGEELERLRHLVQEFSGFARAPAARPRPVDIDHLVREVVELERTRWPALELDAPAPAGEAELDPDAIRGALINLIRNAVAAVSGDTADTAVSGDTAGTAVSGDTAGTAVSGDTAGTAVSGDTAGSAAPTARGGRVVVGVGADRDRIVLSVRDDGPGIPPAEQHRIFEPYVSLRPGGTGLGLAIVRRIAAEHDGRIELESAVGAGSTFRLVLPRRRRPRPPAADDAARNAPPQDDVTPGPAAPSAHKPHDPEPGRAT